MAYCLRSSKELHSSAVEGKLSLCELIDLRFPPNLWVILTISISQDSPKERISAKQALDHQWLKKFPNGSSSKTRSYFVHNMKSYCNSRRLKQMALLTVAFSSENAKAKVGWVEQGIERMCRGF